MTEISMNRSDQNVNDERLAVLLALADELVRTESPEQVLAPLLTRIMQLLNCQMFVFYLVDSDDRLQLQACAGIDDEHTQPLQCIRADADLAKILQVEASVAQPLQSWRSNQQGQSGLGMLWFGSRSHKTFADNELSLLRIAATQIEAALERKGTLHDLQLVNQALQSKEQELEAALRKPDQTTETIPDSVSGLLMLDKDWRYTFFSEAGARMVGMRRDDLLGKCAWDLLPHAKGTLLYDSFHRAMASGDNTHFENYFPEPLNMWLSCHCYPTPEGLTVYFHNINARKQTEDALSQSEQRYRHLFESMDEGFCIIKMLFDEQQRPVDYCFVETNPAFEKHTGLQAPDGKWASELIPDLDESWLQIYGKVALTGDSMRLENHAPVMNRWFDVFAFRTGKPEDMRVALLFSDITVRKNAEQALNKNRAELRTTISSMTDAVFSADAEGRYINFNDAFARFHKFKTTKECLTMFAEHPDFLEVCFPDGSPVPAEMWAMPRALRGETGTEEYILRRRDTDETWIASYSFGPSRDKAGNIVGAVVTARDITEQRRRALNDDFLAKIGGELATLSSADELANALGTSIGTYLKVQSVTFSEIDMDANTLTVKYNWRPEGARNLNRTFPLSNFFYNQTGKEHQPDEVIVIRDVEKDLIRIAKTYAELQLRAILAVPSQTKGNKRAFFSIGDHQPRDWRPDEIEMFKDLANRVFPRLERAQAEAALRESEARLREADQRKNEFLAILSHELRNPLAPIRTGVQLLKLGYDSPGARAVVPILERQVEQMSRLLDDLLDVSRIIRGTIELRREPIELAQVVQAAVESISPMIHAKGHQLDVQIPSEPVLLDADPVRLSQIFSNLLNNAAKFMEEPGMIELRAELQAQEVVVSVKDRGMGIPANSLTSIFDLFSQVRGPKTNFQDGLGIGLSLVKRLVELHGGSAEARSAGLGQGSEFLVSLPVLTEQGHPGLDRPSADEEVTQLKILVVDDNEDAASSLSMLLKLSGHEVLTANSGLEAVRVVPEFEPQVVLLDLGMPDMDGYEVCHMLRQLPGGEQLTIIAATGWGQEEDRRKTKEAGFNMHMVKPLDTEMLRTTLYSLR